MLARQGASRVTKAAEAFPFSLNAVSKHVKVLEQAGLVNRRLQGRDHWLSLNPEPLAQAHAWIGVHQRFWEARMDELESFLRRRNES